MGSKRVLAPTIAGLIDDIDPEATVADAFAGTCAVATAVSPAHPVVANDIHEFAATVARALLTGEGNVPTPARAASELRRSFLKNRHALEDAIGDRIQRERAAVRAATAGGRWRQLVAFTEEELEASPPIHLPGLPPYSRYKTAADLTPYSLFSALFSSTYFGVEQAAEIDSLRYAIDQGPPENASIYMLALLQAVSHCGAAPGHFAQFLIPRDERNTDYIARIRRRSVLERFFANLSDLHLPASRSRDVNRVTRMDAVDFVQALPEMVEGELIIYADPPYSRAQYSRYYHVLETLVLYDYPNVSGKGRYRPDRFNTDFSRSAKVESAMYDLIAMSAQTGAPLLLSYPRNGLMNRDELLVCLGEHYPTVSVAAGVPLLHSTLGGAPGETAINVVEDLYYARWE